MSTEGSAGVPVEGDGELAFRFPGAPGKGDADAGDPSVGPVERSIREAMARGEFDHLPGAGKPLPDLDRQYDPDWWARRYLEQMHAEDAADEVRRMIRKELPLLKTMPDRAAAQERVDELNALISGVNRSVHSDGRIPPVSL